MKLALVSCWFVSALCKGSKSKQQHHNLCENLRISPVFSKKCIIPGWNPAGEVVGDASWVLLKSLGQQSLSFLSSPITSPNRLFLLLIPFNYGICELAVLWGKNRNSAFLNALFCIFPFCSPLWIWDRAPPPGDPPAFPISCSFSSPVVTLGLPASSWLFSWLELQQIPHYTGWKAAG